MSKAPKGPFSMTEQFEAEPESAVASPVLLPAADSDELAGPEPWPVALAESDPIGESLEKFHSAPDSMEPTPAPFWKDPLYCAKNCATVCEGTCIRTQAAVIDATPKPGDPQWKDNNPKAAFGAAKVGIDYLSFPVLLEQAVGMMAGGYKYGAHNYLVAGPSVMTYIAAAFRHMAAYVGGEELDPHAGEGVKVHHLVAAQNCLHVVRAAQIAGIAFDDRPPAMPEGFIESLAPSVAALQKNNPDPVARYLRDGKRGPGRIL